MVNEALAQYHFYNPRVEFIRHNENMTYKVIDNEKAYVLRIHKPSEGFNLDILRWPKYKTDLIIDEINLLNCLVTNGNMKTQHVKHNASGNHITMLDNSIPVTVLEWIEGITLENIDIDYEIATKLGFMIGTLHNELAQNTFKNRYDYDSALLARMIDEASQALIQGHFSTLQANIITDTLTNIKSYLSDSSDRFIPVHADLGKSNLIYNNETIVPIDFSLSGYCVPEMDLASVFSHINNEALQQKILSGYKSISTFEVDDFGIEICFCLQILLFVIFQHSRFADEAWFREKLTDWCDKYFVPLNTKCIK